MMSPRRSSRARVTQIAPAGPGQTNSSNSSVSSGRQERSTRSSHKQTSPRRSDPRSQSLDDVDDTKPPPRRTRSGHEDIKESIQAGNEDNIEKEEDDAEEEEVTRCICGQLDYPGLPSPVQEQLRQQAKLPDAKYELESINDDLGGLFVQCDTCKVWQHGGCVGIFDEMDADYFCEKCRRDLHKISTTPSGTRYSTYLPLHGQASPSRTPEPLPRSRRNDARVRQLLEPTKRRSTMNSREIYDEAEEFRRAIEESKKEANPSDTGRRKRGRDEPDDVKVSLKRQRTGSKSDSAEADNAQMSSSDEALAVKAAVEQTAKKLIRGAAARNHAAKELREQKERERIKAADSRKSRMEKRRADDSDNVEEPQPTPQSAVSSPPAPESATSRPSIKKPSKPTPKSAKRMGRNQQTKDRDTLGVNSTNSLDPSSGDLRNTRGRSRSRSVARDMESPQEHVNGGSGGSSSRLSKIKHLNPNRTSMNEMKKRIAAIMEYINRAEEEMNRQASIRNAAANGSPDLTTQLATSSVPDEYKSVAATALELDFGTLDSKDMIKVLKARLVAWEDEYGRYPR